MKQKILFSVKSEILQHNSKLMYGDNSEFDRVQSLLLSPLKLRDDQHMTLCPGEKKKRHLCADLVPIWFPDICQYIMPIFYL